MSRAVTIKGSGNGVVLVLDADLPFDELRGELAERIHASRDFFRDAQMPVRIRGRALSDDEKAELLEIIRQNARVKFTELIDEAPVAPKKLTAEEIFADSGPVEEEERIVGGDTEELSDVDHAILKELEKQLSGEFAIMHAGPVKNGETIRSEHSLIILGDVRTGGRVEANGSIIVLGSLFGDAAAGMEGNRSAIVMSGNLKPQSLSIGTLTGYRTPARQRRRPFGKKRLMEVACVKNGEVVRMVYDDFIHDNSMV